MNSWQDGQVSSSRQAHLRGLALLIFAIVLGTLGAAWEIASPNGPESLHFASLSLSTASGQQEHFAMPRVATGLVETSSNRGQVLFGRYCDSCHPAGQSGIGASMRDSQFKQEYATEDKIIQVVRSGGFSMPAFPSSLLSDDDLDAIAQYVLSLPQQGQ
ncbi:MAG: cytochrome c [Chloroflexi bacterium]|nr:cytochrome c [Chloroflexota bacterium]